jgi:hypothetical protein
MCYLCGDTGVLDGVCPTDRGDQSAYERCPCTEDQLTDEELQAVSAMFDLLDETDGPEWLFDDDDPSDEALALAGAAL